MGAGQGTVLDAENNTVKVIDSKIGDAAITITKNFTKGNTASRPTSDLSGGQLYYDTEEGEMKSYNSDTTSWDTAVLAEDTYYFETGDGRIYRRTGPAAVEVLDDPVVLTHGSVDHTAKKAFTLDPDAAPSNPKYLDKGANASTNWQYKPDVKVPDSSAPTPVVRTVDVYVAVSWTMTFRYTFAGDTTPVALYLDLHDSTFSEETGNPNFTKDPVGKTEETKKSFRVAFMNGTHPMVWGNNTPVPEAPTINKGVFAGDVSYDVDDIVVHNNEIYTCATAITYDGAHANEWDASKWTKYSGRLLAKDSYAAGKAYSVKDIIEHEGKAYYCKTAVATSTDWGTDGGSFIDISGSALSYVTAGGNSSATANYTATEYVNSTALEYPRLENLVEYAGTNEKAERITVIEVGKFNGVANPAAATGGYGEVTIECAAWFEGTDPNVISGAAMDCLKAEMSVYARKVNPGAKPAA